GGVSIDLSQVGEGVVAAVRGVVVERSLAAQAEPGPRAVRADLVEGGVAAALDPPALVIGEVQVQTVQLEGGERVDQGQDLALGEEVPGDVEVGAAPGQGGGVADDRAVKAPVVEAGGRGCRGGGAPGVVGQ